MSWLGECTLYETILMVSTGEETNPGIHEQIG